MVKEVSEKHMDKEQKRMMLKEILQATIEALNEKYKRSKISIHPWGVVIEPSSRKVKKQ